MRFDGYTKGNTCVHDFLKNVMMFGEEEAGKISKSLQQFGRTPKTNAWCRLVFTEDAILKDLTAYKNKDNPENQDRAWFLYRAFVIAKMSDDSVPAEDVIKRMLGDKMHTNVSEQDPSYRVLSENAEWVSHEYTVQWPSKGSDIKKLSLNDVIARGVWRTLSLAGKHPKKPANKKGTTQWVKVAAEAKAVGTGNTTKVLYLEYGKQIPDNVEEIPFMYLPLTDAYLPKSPRPDSCAGKDVYLVFVAQRREQRMGK